MIINTKKGMEMTFPIIVGIVIAMLVLVIIGIIFFPKFFTLGGEIGKNILSLNDTDHDKVPDFQDKCPCTAALIQSKLLPGCKKDTTEADALKDMEKYSSTGCKTEETSSSSSSSTPVPEIKLQLSDETGQKITVSGYEVKGSKVFFEYSCANCQVSITLPEGMTTKAPENINSYTLDKSGTYTFTLFENGKQIEQHSIIKK